MYCLSIYSGALHHIVSKMTHLSSSCHWRCNRSGPRCMRLRRSSNTNQKDQEVLVGREVSVGPEVSVELVGQVGLVVCPDMVQSPPQEGW